MLFHRQCIELIFPTIFACGKWSMSNIFYGSMEVEVQWKIWVVVKYWKSQHWLEAREGTRFVFYNASKPAIKSRLTLSHPREMSLPSCFSSLCVTSVITITPIKQGSSTYSGRYLIRLHSFWIRCINFFGSDKQKLLRSKTSHFLISVESRTWAVPIRQLGRQKSDVGGILWPVLLLSYTLYIKWTDPSGLKLR